MLHKWLKAGFVDKHRLYPTEAGVPQGGICSPVIANLTLDGLERLLRAHYPPNTKRAQRAKVNLVRYCDDFIITGSSQAVLEQEVKPLVEHFLHERGLELRQIPRADRLDDYTLPAHDVSVSARFVGRRGTAESV